MNRQRTLTLGNYIGKSLETSKIHHILHDVVETDTASCDAVVLGKSQPPYRTDLLHHSTLLPNNNRHDEDEEEEEEAYESTLDISPCRPSRKLSKANLFESNHHGTLPAIALSSVEKTTSSSSCHITKTRDIVSLIHNPSQDNDTDDDETASCTSASFSVTTMTSDSSWCSSSSDSTTSCDKEQEKRVRFRVVDDDTDEIEEEIGILSYPRHDLTPNDKRKAWWSKLERRRMKQSVPGQCEYAIYKHPTYRRVAFQTMTMLNHMSMEDLQDQFHSNLDVPLRRRHHHPIQKCSLRESLPVLVQSDSRGLERAMMKRLQLPRPDVKAHVHSVLRHQQSLRFVHALSEEEKQHILAEQASADSEWARKWALVMAHGDAQAVHKNDDEIVDTEAFSVKNRVKRVIHFL